MADRLVEVLAAHGADEPAALGDEDPALAVALAGDHRGATVSSGHRPGRRRHDVAARTAGARRGSPRAGVRASSGSAEDRRRACGWPAPPSAAAVAPRRVVRAAATTANTRRPSRRAERARGIGQSTILCARFETPSTYAARTAATSTSTPPCGASRRLEQGVQQRRSSRQRRAEVVASTSWRAPWRRHQASASASRRVVVGTSASPCPRGSRARTPSPRAG